MERVKVKYSRDENKHPTKTLVYFNRNGMIYFGVAKCNAQDVFFKSEGRRIAYERAQLAVKIRAGKVAKQRSADSHFEVSGFVSEDNYKLMLQYFDAV